MHVALIVNEERLVHEHPTLNRIAVGLIGEGVQLTRIVPELGGTRALHESEERMALATRLQAPMRVLPWMRGERRARLLEALERNPPQVLYALGEEAWDLGRDLARSLDRALAIDVWSCGQTRRVPRGRAAATVAGYVAPTRPIAEALRQRVDPSLVCLVPMGVALPPEPRRVLADPESSIAIAVLGGGRDLRSYHAMLRGLGRVIRERPQVQAFLELGGPGEHEIWRQARRLDLLENVTPITDAPQHRALLTRCDMLLLPERNGELRSLILESMAFGMPVVTGDSPALEMLADDDTARVVSGEDGDAWARVIGELVDDPARARALGLSGRRRVAESYRSSDHVTCLLHTLERIAREGPYPFEAGE